MRIGVMLRSIDETGGIGIYARNIVKELLEIDRRNEYVLFYQTEKHVDRFADFSNVKTVVLKASNKLVWDQIAIPRAAAREKIDLIFNPKFTVPLCTRAKTVMVVHGADWFIPPYHKVYDRADVQYIKTVMPLYFRRADFVISVSDYSTGGFVRRFPQHQDKIRTVYFGPNEIFRRIESQPELESIRQKYALPERFILTVIRYDTPRMNKRKNLRKMLEAYKLCKERTGLTHKFVVVGKNCDQYAQDYDVAGMGLADDVIFPGLVMQADLPAFYTLADLYLYPTVIEAFPIPITEAMACGCAIVTSHDTGLDELAGSAALKVDPQSATEIAAAIGRVLEDDSLRINLGEQGLERSKIFSWKKCGRETLESIESVGSSRVRG